MSVVPQLRLVDRKKTESDEGERKKTVVKQVFFCMAHSVCVCRLLRRFLLSVAPFPYSLFLLLSLDSFFFEFYRRDKLLSGFMFGIFPTDLSLFFFSGIYLHTSTSICSVVLFPSLASYFT